MSTLHPCTPALLDLRHSSDDSAFAQWSVWGSALRATAAYLVIPNLAFLAARPWVPTQPRGWINLDYLAAGIFAALVPGWLSTVVFILVWLVDAITSYAALYYLSGGDLLSSAQFLIFAPRAGLLLPLAWLIVIGIILSYLSRWSAGLYSGAFQLRRIVIVNACVAALLLGHTLLFSSSRIAQRDAESSPGWTYSGIMRWTRLMLVDGLRKPPATDGQPLNGVTQTILQSLRSGAATPAHNIVLVLVESYGAPVDPDLASTLLKPYRTQEIERRFTVETGDNIPFSGATVRGEMRELCGLNLGLESAESLNAVAARCLPELLLKRGLETYGLHGFSKYMFDRSEWWKALGIDHRTFLEDLPNSERHDLCDGAFLGACDGRMAGKVVDILKRSTNQPVFVYWVTLTSHLPLNTRLGADQSLRCGVANPAVADPVLCTWSQLILNVNGSVAAMASDRALPPTEFYIVGDHAPPFVSRSERALFDQGHVTFIHLTPRGSDLNLSQPQKSNSGTKPLTSSR